MINTALSQLKSHLNARLIGGDAQVKQVFTDSREKCDGGLFVALHGPHFDAHNFLANAIDEGACALVVERESAIQIPQLVVPNTKLALGDLARYNRSQLDARFVAITGSSGKTTVKEMVASILQLVGNTFATKGNFNNDIGAPLTILEMNQTHQYGVIELGANHPGEIAYTADITRPDVAVINNVAAAHLQGFGDLQGVARAKGEIYSELKEDGIAVINNDDDFANFWKKNIKREILTFSRHGEADLVANNVQLDINQCPQFELEFDNQKSFISLPLAGIHNVNNALSASACCLALGISLKDIARGLSQTPVVTGRLMTESLANGCRLIDDTYNANLDSMSAAIELLSQYKGKRILVVGDMAELGEFGRQCHEEVGLMSKQAGIDVLYSCGVLTQFTQSTFAGEGEHFSAQKQLIDKLSTVIDHDTTILVKGSRSAHMENVVNALIDKFSIAEQKDDVTSQQEAH